MSLIGLVAVFAGASASSQVIATYPIGRVNRQVPAEDVFRIRGYVTAISECPSCPPSAVCAPCPPPAIIVSSRNRTMLASDPLGPEDVRVETGRLSGLRRQNYYELTIRRGASPDPDRTKRVFQLIAFQPASPGQPQLTRIEDAGDIARIRAIVEGRLGRDFSLDHLPGTPTLDSGLAHLVTNGRDTVKDALTGVPIVYALAFTVSVEGVPVTVFAYATSPDARGEFVYCVSRYGDSWPVFFASR